MLTGVFSSFSWSPDKTKLLYMAERKSKFGTYYPGPSVPEKQKEAFKIPEPEPEAKVEKEPPKRRAAAVKKEEPKKEVEEVKPEDAKAEEEAEEEEATDYRVMLNVDSLLTKKN